MGRATSAVLPRPRIIGRLVRLSFGLVLLHLIWPLSRYRLGDTLDMAAVMPWVGLLFGLWVLPEVVNLGLVRRWGQAPRLLATALLALVALVDLAMIRDPFGPAFGFSYVIFMGYVYIHLGLSFVVAALVAAPG